MSELPQAEIDAATSSVGRTETQSMILDTQSLRRYSLAIGGDGDVASHRPVLAHWAWFLPAPQDSEIGEDGHPKRGGFLPALESLPRRMFASTAISFDAPLILDTQAEMTQRIASVNHKSGRSGDLVFVDVERIIAQEGQARVTEMQTLVYRGAGDAGPAPLPEPESHASDAPEGGEVWTPGTVNLFRFSSVTFNGHRIHYDLPYAKGVEGYPALIVHGPFIASKIAELAARRGELASLKFRAQSPCFVDQPIRLGPAGESGEFQALRCDGAVATAVSVEYR